MPNSWLCACCTEYKPLEQFYLHSNGKPRKQCKACRNHSNSVWRANNPDKIWKPTGEAYLKTLAAARAWRVRNKKYDAFRSRTYRARKLQRTPTWASLEQIKQFYLNCPDGFHVDHIVPLKGTKVSGLHVIENLQYLPAIENIKKRNIYHV